MYLLLTNCLTTNVLCFIFNLGTVFLTPLFIKARHYVQEVFC